MAPLPCLSSPSPPPFLPALPALPFPASLALLGVAVGAGIVYVRLGAVRGRGWRRAGRTLVLAVVWMSPLATSGPGPAQLTLGLLVPYLGIRAAALAQRRGGPPLRAGEIARELLIPRPLLAERASPVRRPGRLLARGALAMGACVALLVAGDAVRLWRWSRFLDDLLVFVEVAVGAAGIHDMIVGVAALAFGRHVRGLLDRPELSTSLSQFWGRRWNRQVQTDLDRGFFRPLARRGRWRAGTMAAFAASGVMHAVAVLDADRWEVTLLPAAGVMFFFLLNGALILIEQAFQSRAAPARHGPAPLGGGHAGERRSQLLWRRIATLTAFAVLSPLLLDPFAAVTHVHGRRLAQSGEPGPFRVVRYAASSHPPARPSRARSGDFPPEWASGSRD